MIFCKWYIPENLNLNLVKIIENMALAVNNHSRDVLVKIFNANDQHKSKFENLIENEDCFLQQISQTIKFFLIFIKLFSKAEQVSPFPL